MIFYHVNVRDPKKYKEIYDYRMQLKREGKKKEEQQPYKNSFKIVPMELPKINIIIYLILYKLIMFV